MPHVEVRMLGPLEVVVGGRRLELRRKKERALLALLALRAGEVVSRDRLVDELWGESPPKAALSSLQNIVSELRKRLEPELLVTRAPGYVLELERGAVDAQGFEELVREGRAAPGPEERAALLRRALSLWRGPPFADLAFEPFALLASPRLEELHLLAYEDLIDAELALGLHAELLQEVEALVEKHPFDERLRAQLMVVLYRSGRQADALDAYRETRRFLIDELGIEPSAQLREVELAILRQDPALAPQAPLRRTLPVRKTVSVLFADLVDSTALVEQLDPEALRQLHDLVFSAMRGPLERHGGTVEKFIGDAVLAVFGVPTAHEDDAHRAVRAAVEMREAVAALRAELERERGLDLRVRIGISTGEVFVGDPTTGAIATGAAVNVAKRLEEAAPPGEILLGAPTLGLVRDAVSVDPLEPLELRAGSALGAWRLLAIATGAPAIARRLEAPLVGRRHELTQLRSALEQARAERRSRLVVLVGEPGIGKTRLVRELTAGVNDEATVLVGACVSYGEGATWLPLADMVRQLGDLSRWLGDGERGETVARRVEELVGVREGQASREEGFSAVRELLEAVARRRPLVAVFDDVHWAEPTLLDLIDVLGGRSAEVPLLLLALTRPELLDSRPHLADHAITLERLASEEAGALIDSLQADLTHELRSRVLEVARGNPLFVEQLVAHAGEEQELALQRFQAVPPSVEALLASRLDLLAPEERTVLQRASVVGPEFSYAAIGDLCSADGAMSVDARLRSLGRKGFIRTSAAGERFGFHHVLVRDVAYAAIPKAERAELHERLADWLERGEAEEVGELDEVVGYHLEQASRYRRELMPRDQHALTVGRRAAKLLAAAGRRAPARADWPGAAALLSRAVALLPEGDPERLPLLPDLARAVGLCGDYRRELALLDQAVERAEAAGDRQTRSYAVLYRDLARTHVDPAFSVAAAEADAQEALRVFEQIGDADGQARAWARLAHCRWFSGHHVEARHAAERTLAHALTVGDEALEAECHGLIGNTLLNGPDPLDDLFAYGAQLTEPGHRRLWTLLGRAHAMRGDFSTARRLIEQDVVAFEEVGSAFAAVRSAGEGFATIELLAGDLRASERYLTESLQALTEAGETGHLSSVAARLANAVSAQGRHDEAERLTYLSEETASRDDYLSQILWRSTRGRALAGQGRVGEGERLVLEAVAIAESSDDINLRADTLVVLAEVVRIAHRLDEVAPPIDAALHFYDAKGNVVSAHRARVLQDELQATAAL
jgi:DNA-binding SARP family transcriptional activator/tetratricopeptide (TPR) repeat protein